MDAQRELTFGEKAVGLTFNPSNDQCVQELKSVQELKTQAAAFIDNCNDMRVQMYTSDEEKRMLALAISRAQEAQMWAVKAATWNL